MSNLPLEKNFVELLYNMSKRDNSGDKSDRMSSVSQCSNFSIKSQQYIAKQDGQMAAMRKAMFAAGLDPDMVIA